MISRALFLAILILAVAAHASDAPTQAVKASIGLPAQGALDTVHNATTLGDPVSGSLYALRNTLVEELLQTRKAIKILIGGTARARKQRRNPEYQFGVPDSINHLYIWSDPEKLEAQGIDEINQPIQWLDSEDPQYDPLLRMKLLKGLVYVSAQIVRIEQKIKFIQKDFWADLIIAKQADSLYSKSFAFENEGRRVPRTYLEQAEYDSKKRDWISLWLRDHGMTETLSVLDGYREYLLSHYALLGVNVPVNSQAESIQKPLYQALYGIAVTENGFPDPNEIQEPVKAELPLSIAPIPLPEKFDQILNSALSRFSELKLNKFESNHLRRGNTYINYALLQLLDENTKALEDLGKNIDVDLNAILISPYLIEMAKVDPLWEKTAAKYGYLEKYLQFDSSRKQIISIADNIERNRKEFNVAGYALATSIGALSLASGMGEVGIASWGWRAIHSATLGSRAGLTASVPLGFNYADSKIKESVAKTLFFGNLSGGSFADYNNAVAMRQEDYSDLIRSMLFLCPDVAAVSLFSKGRTLIQYAGGKVGVLLQKSELNQIRKWVSENGALAKQYGFSFGQSLATRLKVDSSQFEAILKSTPISPLISGWRARVEKWPEFNSNLLRELGSSVALNVTVQYQTRDQFEKELNYVTIDTVTLMAATGIMYYLIKNPYVKVVPENASVMEKLKERLVAVRDNTWKFGVSGLSASMIGNGIISAVQHYHNPDFKTVDERVNETIMSALYTGAFVGVSSNLRYTLGIKPLEELILKKTQNLSKTTLIMSGISNRNNVFANWTYVIGAKEVGAQNEFRESGVAGTDEKKDIYLKIERNDESAVSTLFDFLG